MVSSGDSNQKQIYPPKSGFICYLVYYLLDLFLIFFIFHPYVPPFFLLYYWRFLGKRCQGKSSSILDTYLYSDSYRSEILTSSAIAIFSRFSNVGEYLSFMILLIVDLGIPAINDSCRTEMFFLYMISPSRIFMYILYLINFVLSMEILSKENTYEKEKFKSIYFYDCSHSYYSAFGAQWL